MKQSKKDEVELKILQQAHKAIESALELEVSWGKNGNVLECPLPLYKNTDKEYEPLVASLAHAPYRRISAYPFMLRDIAMWATGVITKEDILAIIRTEGGELLVHNRLFDVFTKDSKTSYAFNLVFQSYERTLSDVEINEIMAHITEKLSAKGLEVR